MKNFISTFRKKKYFLSILLFFISSLLSAQILSLPGNANFFDYLQAARNSDYFSDQDTAEGGFKAKLTRLELQWGSRLYPHGNFSIANRAIIEYANNYQFVPSSVQPNWVCIGPANTPTNDPSRGVGQIHRITFAPDYGISNNTIYASSGFGGLWRSEDNAENWHLVNTDNLPITTVADIAICSTNGNIIFISTGLPDGGVNLTYSPNWANINPIFTIGVYRSFDYGQTWHTINTGLMDDFFQNGGTIRKMEADPNNPNIIFLATSNGIYKTSNALDTVPVWTKVFSGITTDDKDFRTIKFKPGNSEIIYASSNNIFRSTDSGNTWHSLTGQNFGIDFNDLLPFVPNRINLAVTPANSSRVFAYLWGTSNGAEKVYLYYFNGTNWVNLYYDSGYFAKEWMALAVSPVNPDEYYFYGKKGVFGSKTLSWPTQKSDYISHGTYADGHVLEFQPNIYSSPLLFFGHHGGISIGNTSPSGSVNWQKKNNGLANLLLWSFDDSEFYSDIVVTAKQDHYADILRDGQWLSLGHKGDSYSAKTSKVNSLLFFGSNNDATLYRHNINNTSSSIDPSYLRPNDVASVGSKTHYTKTFQLKSPPNTIYDFFTFSEIYKRKLDTPIPGNLDPDHLWEVCSDIGKLEIAPWKRQLNEYDFCYTQPLNQYVANGAQFNSIDDGYWFSPILAKTTTGGLENGQYYLYDAYEQLTIPGVNGEFPIISGIAVHPEDPLKVWISMIGYDNLTMRVAFSQDGGYTWANADPNSSLPTLPVNNIVYQYGSNDVIYIGTDAGIYYKDASMQNWEKYGDFPNVRVMELKINYCQNKLRAATFGRSVWEADLMPFTHSIFYEINSGEDIIWPKDKALHTSLKIKSGGKLTVEGFLSMPVNSKIIVEDSATLVVNGGKIANMCGESWQGIEVHGNSTAHQWPDANGNYQQGRVVLNNATIENAICALNLWNPGHYEQTGGIVHATKTRFKNNTNSVHALLYRNFHPINGNEMEYNTSFDNCTFEISEDYHGFHTFYKHIDLNQINGIKFKSCDFSLSPDANNVSDYNQAISAYCAGFKVEANCKEFIIPCNDWDMSTFNGFRVGIYAGNSSVNNYSYLINRAIFSGNSIGVLSNKVDNGIIINSEFYSAKNKYNWEDCTYGIFVESGAGFTFEDNKFYKQVGAPLSNYIGIGAFNCETVSDIYKNEFTGLTAGNFAYGKNYNRYLYNGLEYICNTNTGNWADFYVMGKDDTFFNGIQSKQGNTFMPARNQFSPTGAAWHFYNETNNLIGYYYCQSCPGHYPVYVENVTREPVTVTGNCLSHYGSENPSATIVLNPASKINMETAFAFADMDFNNVNVIYNSLKDGGSTAGTISDISQALPSEMIELRAKLLGDSPHLTTEVLKLVADRTDVFPEIAIFDILSANPDELKKEELMKYLEEKENPLPEYMISILKQVAEGTSYRTVLEMEMAKYAHDRSHAAGDIIRSILNKEELDFTQLRLWLSNLGGIEAERQIIASYAHSGDFTLALALAETLPQTYQLTGNDLTVHNQFVSVLQLHQNLATSGRNIDQLTEPEQDQLRVIAETDNAVSAPMAKAILESFYGDNFSRCKPIDGTASYKSQPASPNQLAVAYGISITIKPNPANEWVTFDYILPEGVESAGLEIVDAYGRRVETIVLKGNRGQQLVDTRSWIAGQYVYTLKIAGFTQSGKLFVVN